MDKLGIMEQAVVTLEETARTVDSKLDSLNWKFEEFEKGVVNVVKDNPERVGKVSVKELMQNIETIRKEYANLTDEVLAIKETEKEISSSVNAEITTLHHNFLVLRQAMKQHE